MRYGYIKVENDAVVTHRDSYMLANLSVVSVRRPYFATAVVLSGLFAGYTAAFFDLLYPYEIIWLALICIGMPVLGSQFGELRFVSRDLRGSELASVIYGQYGRLNRIRRKIAWAMARRAQGGQP